MGSNHLNTRFLGVGEGVFGFETYQELYTFSGGDKRVIGFEAYQYLYKFVGGWKRCFRIQTVSVIFVGVLNALSDLNHISSCSSLWGWKRCFQNRTILVNVRVCGAEEGVFGFESYQ